MNIRIYLSFRLKVAANHFSVHFEQDGAPNSMLLDVVEVARSHSGLNLAAAFVKILDDFGISDKVR